jgi:polysaccharide export outer membrane protein
MRTSLKLFALLAMVFALAQAGCSHHQSAPLTSTGESRNNIANSNSGSAGGDMDAASGEAMDGQDTDMDNAPAAASATTDPNAYKINAGDVLQVTVWKEDSLDREVLVLPDGSISFPLIGSLNVQNKTPAQVQATIKSKLHSFIPDASVSVVVKADLGHTVSVIGQVTKPGEIMMGHRLTVMEALSQAGGLTPYANEGRIIILHHENGKEISIPFPYSDIIEGDDLDKDIVLSPGDVVVVPTAGLL